MVGRVADAPERRLVVGTDAEAGRAERKIYEAVRGTRARRGGEPIMLSEAELNAFVARHVVEAVDAPLDHLTLKLVGDGVVELQARMPLYRVAADPPLSYVTELMPTRWQAYPVALRLRAHLRVEDADGDSRRRILRLQPEGFWVGRQRLPTVMARLLIDPAALRMLRWRLPRAVDDVDIERGRAIIHPPSSH
ncbi:MAG: hypothetical protein ACREJG_01140 [Candidatus Rokuibacteriota bacterium]